MFASIEGIMVVVCVAHKIFKQMGITKLNLACQEFLRSLILAIVSILFAIPLGVAISFILTKYVNVSAFGWELPISIHINDIIL